MGECVICLSADPPPVQSGCACRGDAGLAHGACLIEKARAQYARRRADAWTMCQTCTQAFSGASRLALAEAWCFDAPSSTDALSWSGLTMLDHGRYADAERIFRGVLAGRRARYGDEDELTLVSMGHLSDALAYQGRHEDVESIARETLRTEDAVRARYGGTPAEPSIRELYLAARTKLARSHSVRGQYAEAVRIMRDVVSEFVVEVGEGHIGTLEAKDLLATALAGQNELCEAEALLREVAAHSRRMLGEEHDATLKYLNNLATRCLMPQRMFAAAETIQRGVLSARRRTIGEEHERTLATAHDLAHSIWGQGRRGEALELARHVHAATVRAHGPSHPETRSVALTLAQFSEPPCAASACTGTVRDASACARCGARIYCSRACRLADARAHKRACMRA
jgi:hypothetical protein